MVITDLKPPTRLRGLMCEKQYSRIEIAVAPWQARARVVYKSSNP